MITKEEIQNTKQFNYEMIKSWFIEDVDSYKHPYKIVQKLKKIEELFKINQDLISNLIIENQGLKLNQDLSIEFGEWLQDYEEPIYNIRKLFQEFLKARNENKI